MSDKEPKVDLTINGEKKMESNAKNTKLFTFLGQTAIGDIVIENSSLNHVFISTGENTRGMYLFELFHNDAYSAIAKFAIKHNFPQNLNERHFSEGDYRAFLFHQEADVKEFANSIPSELPETI